VTADRASVPPAAAVTADRAEPAPSTTGATMAPGTGKPLRQALDWGRLAPLRLRAREVTEGLYSGAHRSTRRGPGVEFGGHRSYLPGDDLRFLDRHSMMRHDKLFVREFETETERGVRLVLDASQSMAYRSEKAPGAKLAFAALIAAALARVAVSGQDTVSLDWIGGADVRPLSPTGGPDAFDRVVSALEPVRASGDVLENPEALDRTFAQVARRARRGAVIIVFSDFLDLPEGAIDRMVALGSGGRVIVGVRVLDPAEVSFPFDGPVSLRSSEGDVHIETDGAAARAIYLRALAAKTEKIRDQLTGSGGRFVETVTTDDPVAAVKRVLGSLTRAARGET
jgi:uncharacterized protein (DUF58 family)